MVGSGGTRQSEDGITVLVIYKTMYKVLVVMMMVVGDIRSSSSRGYVGTRC